MPGRSLWYTRLAWERFLSDEIQAWIDGGDAAARFRRVERNAHKNFDQRFWWRPGASAPRRGAVPIGQVWKARNPGGAATVADSCVSNALVWQARDSGARG